MWLVIRHAVADVDDLDHAYSFHSASVYIAVADADTGRVRRLPHPGGAGAGRPAGRAAHTDSKQLLRVSLPSSWRAFNPALVDDNPDALSYQVGEQEHARFPSLYDADPDFYVRYSAIHVAGVPTSFFAADLTAAAITHEVSTTFVITALPSAGLAPLCSSAVELDHVLIAVTDLEAGADELERHHGLV